VADHLRQRAFIVARVPAPTSRLGRRRSSVGIEDTDDLFANLSQALDRAFAEA
jgi:hypothetical protein